MMASIPRTIASSAVVMTLMVIGAQSQSVDDFDAWMRTIDEKNQSVQQHIAARDASAISADARVLQDTFKLVEGFWVNRGNAQDAVNLAKEAQERAADIVKAAVAKDFDAASSQSIKVAETCTPCHRLYRPLP
jgi:hypothetical protein